MERREKLCLQQEFGASADSGALGQSDGTEAHLKTAEEINQSLSDFVARLQGNK